MTDCDTKLVHDTVNFVIEHVNLDTDVPKIFRDLVGMGVFSLEMAEALLGKIGFNPSMDDVEDDENAAIIFAAFNGCVHIMNVLQERRADFSYCNNLAIRWACRGGFHETAKVLLQDHRVHKKGFDENTLLVIQPFLETNYKKKFSIGETLKFFL